MTKKLSCTSVKVMGRRHVLAEMRLSVLEQGEEVAWKVTTDMYNRNSDWSGADPLVRQICQLVFAEYLQPKQSQCAYCGQSFDQQGRRKRYCTLVCKRKASSQRRWQRIKDDPDKLEHHRQVNRDYVRSKRDESQREPDTDGH